MQGLLAAVQKLLQVCTEWNIKLHPGKCVLFATQLRWCGRLLSSEGIRYDPKRLSGLLRMEPLTSGAHLQQFLCAIQWVKNCIKQFSTLVDPLHTFMERVYDQAGKRTKRAVTRIQLSSLGWGTIQQEAFENCKAALIQQVTLAHRDHSKRMCVYTDASDLSWSGIFTQVPH